jgi:hypothetical protein
VLADLFAKFKDTGSIHYLCTENNGGHIEQVLQIKAFVLPFFIFSYDAGLMGHPVEHSTSGQMKCSVSQLQPTMR